MSVLGNVRKYFASLNLFNLCWLSSQRLQTLTYFTSINLNKKGASYAFLRATVHKLSLHFPSLGMYGLYCRACFCLVEEAQM